MFKKRTRPLFSVIISCYNSGDYIEFMLKTLTNQGLRRDELEVIISDDCSTISYDDILDKYNKKLNIKKIVADHNWGFPGHTREQGVSIATGEWITFADHDDGFFDGALRKVKKFIKKYIEKEHFEKTCIYTTTQLGNFYELSAEIDNKYFGVTHGIFFHLDNYWKKYNIHYNMKFRYHEDTYITAILSCLYKMGNIPVYCPLKLKVYCWFSNNQSSLGKDVNIQSNGRFYSDNSFISYIYNVWYARMKYYLIFKSHFDDILSLTTRMMVSCYRYYESILDNNMRHNIEPKIENDYELKHFFDDIEKYLHLNVYELYHLIDGDLFVKTNKDINSIGLVIQQETFYQWIDRIYNIEVPSSYNYQLEV